MRTYITLLLVGLLAFGLSGRAQEYTWNITWTTIEKDLGFRSQWGALGIRLHQLLKDAEKGGDAIATARALYSINRLQDNLYEDTLYFYNSRYQDSLIQQSGTDTLLKVIMLHLKAKRINAFREKYAGRAKAALFRSYMPGEDYANMKSVQLDSMADVYFGKAIELSLKVKNPDIRRLAWICSDPYSLLFKPTVTDLIYLDRLKQKGGNGIVLGPNKLPEDWTKMPIEEFIATRCIDSAYGSIFKAWMDTKKLDLPALAFLDLQFRRTIFNNLEKQENTVFEKYLMQQTGSPYPVVKASAVYQLCMLLSAGRAVDRLISNAVRNKYKQYARAVDLYTANKPLLDSFAVLDVGLTNMVSELTTTYYSVTTKSQHQPHAYNLATVEYRNINKLYLRIIKLNSKDPAYGGQFGPPNFLLAKPGFKDTVVQLPELQDYQVHSAYIKMPALAPGRYVCLFSKSPIDSFHTVEVRAVTYNVSNITAVPMFGRMYVLQSQTGFPMTDARVKMVNDNDHRKWTEWHTVNKEGWVPLKNKAIDSVQVYAGNDTILLTGFPDYGSSNPNVYVKDEYDYRAEYFEENLYMSVFTDRSIYRPGQKVFYKGIVFTRNPRTGEQVILNWGNLKLPFYQKWIARIIQKLGNKKIELVVNDAFGKPFDTLRVWPNKYGSFAGSFTIPVGAPTGEWDFENEWFEVSSRGGSFKVEEYKKPSMFLQINQPDKLLRPGDSIPVVIKVKSFAGADLDAVEVDVRIRSQGASWDVSIDTTVVSRKGLVRLVFADSLARSLRIDSLSRSVYYDILASALTEEGETVEEVSRIDISNRPATIVDKLPSVIDASTPPVLRIGTKAVDGSTPGTRIEVRVTAMQDHIQPSYPDVWLYPLHELENIIGKIDTTTAPKPLGRQWFRALKVNETDTSFLASLPVGSYSMEITCWDNNEIIGQKTRRFSVYDSKSSEIPAETGFRYYAQNAFAPGQEVVGLYGNQRDSSFVVYATGRMQLVKNTLAPKMSYTEKQERHGLQRFRLTVPEGGKGNVEVYRFAVNQGKVMMDRQTIYVIEDGNTPEIIVEKYRQKLAPGSKEKFVVSVKTKNYRKATELLTTMYDASLDKLEEHRWEYPQEGNHWNMPAIYAPDVREANGWFTMPGLVTSHASRPVWWSGFIDPIFENTYRDIEYALQGKVAGISIIGSSENALNEVVVTGYGTRLRKDLTGSVAVVSVRGFSSLKGDIMPMIIIDGVPYTGDPSVLDPNNFTDIAVLKGADATAIYGAKASNGVILISSMGKVQIPIASQVIAEEIPPVIRKNFKETAFFFPQLHADRKGYYTLEFTMPENVTTWKWMMLAHSINAEYGYLEKTITSQLPVMVQPSMPRFLYQGDVITLKSRVTNLDTLKAEGTLKIRIEDAVTGADLTGNFTAQSTTRLSVAEGSNSTGSFSLTIPKEQLNPLKLVISFATSTFSDGEEHLLPVLSNQFLFTASQKVHLKKGKVETPLMKKDGTMKPLGIGYFIDPLPHASMMYALPGLVNYSWDCAEQTFSKIYGYAVANFLMHSDTGLVKSWSRSTIKNENPLPVMLAENSIPWASLASKNQNEQRTLYSVFDTVEIEKKTNELLSHLEDMQLRDGGMPWFKGGKADIYIMTYIVKAIGKMHEEGISLKTTAHQQKLNKILDKMIIYLDAAVKEKENKGYLWNIIGARGYHLVSHPVDSALRSLADSLLRKNTSNINLSLNTQAEWVIMMRHWYPEGAAFAPAISNKLESIRQQAVSDEKFGLRWKELADDEDLSKSHEETVATLAEAFAHSPLEDEVQRGVIKWLMQTRKDHAWGSTKATAQVVGLLGKYAKEQDGPVEVNVDGMKISNDLFSGSLSAFKEQREYPVSVQVEASVATTLGINYYYVSSQPPISEQPDLTLGRNLYYFHDSLKQWQLLKEGTALRVGQRIRVELEIFTKNLLQYVTIQDRRAATFELPGISSGYEWRGDFGYYLSVRDASLQFFASRIPAGRSRISYEMVVSKVGSFSHGHAELSCMYNPARVAYTKALHVDVTDE